MYSLHDASADGNAEMQSAVAGAAPSLSLAPAIATSNTVNQVGMEAVSAEDVGQGSAATLPSDPLSYLRYHSTGRGWDWLLHKLSRPPLSDCYDNVQVRALGIPSRSLKGVNQRDAFMIALVRWLGCKLPYSLDGWGPGTLRACPPWVLFILYRERVAPLRLSMRSSQSELVDALMTWKRKHIYSTATETCHPQDFELIFSSAGAGEDISADHLVALCSISGFEHLVRSCPDEVAPRTNSHSGVWVIQLTPHEHPLVQEIQIRPASADQQSGHYRGTDREVEEVWQRGILPGDNTASCYMCKRRLQRDLRHHPRGCLGCPGWHVEHVMAKSRDEARWNSLNNLLPACIHCNYAKSNHALSTAVRALDVNIATVVLSHHSLRVTTIGALTHAWTLSRTPSEMDM